MGFKKVHHKKKKKSPIHDLIQVIKANLAEAYGDPVAQVPVAQVPSHEESEEDSSNEEIPDIKTPEVKKLFKMNEIRVKNIKNLKEDDLKNYFSKFGEVKLVNVPTSNKNGEVRRRGVAFVEMVNPDDASKVTAKRRGHEICNTKVTCELTYRVDPGDFIDEKSYQLHIYNIGQLSAEELKKFFGKYGDVEKLEIPKFDDGKRKNHAVLTFPSSEEVQKALQDGDHANIDGTLIRYRVYRDLETYTKRLREAEPIIKKNKKLKLAKLAEAAAKKENEKPNESKKERRIRLAKAKKKKELNKLKEEKEKRKKLSLKKKKKKPCYVR